MKSNQNKSEPHFKVGDRVKVTFEKYEGYGTIHLILECSTFSPPLLMQVDRLYLIELAPSIPILGGGCMALVPFAAIFLKKV